jgi:mono/diheme cytochrome c family protein
MKSKIYTLLIAGSLACAPGVASAADAAALWTKNCASCHGKDGSGNTMMGKQLGTKDYRDPKVQAELTDAKAITTINVGIIEHGKERMKPYKGTLSDEEIKVLVAYIRSFKK